MTESVASVPTKIKSLTYKVRELLVKAGNERKIKMIPSSLLGSMPVTHERVVKEYN
jgi:hypothetical protein